MKKRLILVGLVLLLMASVLAGCNNAEDSPGTINITTNQQSGISVSGQGKVAVTPDIAVISLGIQSQQSTVAAAQANAADGMNKVVKALTDGGIANKDIQTQRFSIQIVTRYDSSTQQDVIIGYLVTNMVTARIRTLDKVGIIIDAVASAGGDLTRIDGISFSVEDPAKFYAQARELAMADAKAKAEQMAKLSGVNLGKPDYISESTSYPVTSPVKSIEAARDTSISPGEIDITTNVQVVYGIS